MDFEGPSELLTAAKVSAELDICQTRLTVLIERRSTLLDSRAATLAASSTKRIWTSLGGHSTSSIFKLSPAESLLFSARSLMELESEIEDLENRALSLRKNLERLPDWLIMAVSTGKLPPDSIGSRI